MGNNDEDIKMPDIKHIIPRSDHFISKRIIFTQSWSGIQSTWSEFKFIKFDDRQEGQASEPVEDNNIMVYMEGVSFNVDNNGHLFRHGVDYV